MKTQITKEVTFDAAHRLSFHTGKCRNIHGHTYKLQVTFGGEVDEKGLIRDFYDVKQWLEIIVEKYDHALLLYKGNELNTEITKVLMHQNCKVIQLECEPTVENIAQDIFKYLSTFFYIECVRLYETPTSFAEVLNETVSHS